MKRIPIALCLLFLFSLCSCSGGETGAAVSPSASPSEEPVSAEPEPSPSMTVEEYKSLVRDFVSAIDQPALNAARVANYIETYASAYSKMSGLSEIPDGATEKGLAWFEEKSGLSRDDVESPYAEISSMYREIVTAGISGPEVSEIDGYVRDLFSAYKTIYDLVFSPSGSASSYAVSLYNATSQYSDCVDYLEIFLSEDEE